jgi:hypothetical protein
MVVLPSIDSNGDHSRENKIRDDICPSFTLAGILCGTVGESCYVYNKAYYATDSWHDGDRVMAGRVALVAQAPQTVLTALGGYCCGVCSGIAVNILIEKFKEKKQTDSNTPIVTQQPTASDTGLCATGNNSNTQIVTQDPTSRDNQGVIIKESESDSRTPRRRKQDRKNDPD